MVSVDGEKGGVHLSEGLRELDRGRAGDDIKHLCRASRPTAPERGNLLQKDCSSSEMA